MNAVRFWFLQSFQLLEPVKSRWLLVIFCGVFSFLFLNIFEPFNISSWFEGIDTSLFIIITFFFQWQG